MKLRPLIFWILLIACCPSLAAKDERFVELEEYPAKTRTYDLRSVQMIRGRICKTPEEYKAWSQNLGHEPRADDVLELW